MSISATGFYAWCIWVRLGAGSPASVGVFDMELAVWSNERPIAYAQATPTAAWQRVCLPSYQPLVDSQSYYRLRLAAPATYHFDDAVITYAQAAVPEGSYARAKADAPVSSFFGANAPYTQKYLMHNQPLISGSRPNSVGVLDLAGAGTVSHCLRWQYVSARYSVRRAQECGAFWVDCCTAL